MEDRNDIVIDEEFAALLVPLTPQEEALLRDSLKRHGCTEPLAVWEGKNVLLDGHAGLKLCRENNIPFRTEEVKLADREAARQWVWQRQAGRRNLRPVAAAYTAGVLYRSIEKRPGARTDRTSGQKARKWASEEVARYFGLDESTIRRHSRLARDLDLIARDLGDEFRRAILTGEARLSRKDITTLAGMSRSEKERHLRKLEKEKEEGRAARRKTRAADRPAAAEQTGHVALAATADKTGNRPSEAETLGLAESPTVSPDTPLARTASEYTPDEATLDYRHEAPGHTAAGHDRPSSDEDEVDEAVLGELTELFRQASHATRLAFLGQPAVQARIRRLNATMAVPA